MRHAYADANGVAAESYTYSHIHSDSDGYGNVYSDSYGDVYSYSNGNSYGHGNSNCDRDCATEVFADAQAASNAASTSISSSS
jgi:hypothetical protein